MQERPNTRPSQQPTSQATPVHLTTLQLKHEFELKVREVASERAYRELKQLNETQQKVTEQDLLTIATNSGTTRIVGLESIYGPADLTMKIYVEVFRRIWRDGGAVVSQTEKDALLNAQEQKRKDEGPGEIKSPLQDVEIRNAAKKFAREYVLETPPPSDDREENANVQGEISAEQRAQINLYVEAYIRAYKDYKLPEPPQPPRRKLFGIF